MTDKKLARIAGLCYLIVIATGLFSEVFVRQALHVSNNALATAHNIQTHELLFRFGIAADIINFVIGLPSVIIIYALFKRINQILLQLALALVIIQTAVIAVNILNQISAVQVLSNATYLNTFQASQLSTLALFSLNLQAQGYAIGLVFFGCYCVIIGYVSYRSQMIPKILGVLYIISGAGYLVNSFTMFLSKTNPVFDYVAIPIFIGELAFCLWLLIKGVDTSKVSFNNK